MHLAGKSNVAIAAELSVDEKTVRNDLERLNELWRERVGGEIEEMRAQAVAEMENIRLLALDAYDFDRRMEEAVLTGGTFVKDDGEEQDIYHDAKGAASFRGGKSASLAVALNAAEKKAKVLGLVIDKQDITSGGQPLVKAYIGVDLDKV